MRMKIEQLRDIVDALAKTHPDATVFIAYPARHGGRPTTRRGQVTGHTTRIHTIGGLHHTIILEVEHARAENISDD